MKNLTKNQVPNGIASQIRCSRTFKAWLIELRNKARERNVELPDMNLDRAKMFFNGGYSPKMVINEELRIPSGWDIL